jgi:hypothetical protein
MPALLFAIKRSMDLVSGATQIYRSVRLLDGLKTRSDLGAQILHRPKAGNAR